MKISLRRKPFAFTLLEVAIAMGIFFVAMFSILELTSQSLRSVQMLTRNRPSPTILVSDLVMTNTLEISIESGNFADLGMEEVYPNYAWERAITEANTNGLFQVDVRVYSTNPNSTWESSMSAYFYRPESVSGLTGQARQARGARLNQNRRSIPVAQ